MKNFKFIHENKEYWYSRSMAVLGMVFGKNRVGDLFVLANKRGVNTPDYQGMWNMPCGYLDFDETCEEAVIREIFEETGLKIGYFDSMRLVSINSDPKESNKQNVTVRYKIVISKCVENVILTSKNAEPGEVDSVKWINVNNIGGYNWAFNHYDLIKEYYCY